MTPLQELARPSQRATEEDIYFNLMVEMDFTKHLGGRAITDQIVQMCAIKPHHHVLDVGCGVGFTPVYLAQKIGCRVTAVDIREGMVARANARFIQEGVADRVTARVADGQALPFDANTFDVVIGESVVAFFPDKVAGLREWLRVTRPGGIVAFTEATWIKDPPPGFVANKEAIFGQNLDILDGEAWQQVLVDAGLKNVHGHVRPISATSEARERIRRLGWGNILRLWGRALRLLFTRPVYRKFARSALRVPENMFEYWGVGVWAGQK